MQICSDLAAEQRKVIGVCMPLSLKKNGKTCRMEQGEKLEFISASLLWSARHSFGPEFDLDISCFMLGKEHKIRSEKDFIFYNNPVSQCGAIIHTGDNPVGEEEGEAEVINVDLPKIPADVESIAFAVSIHEAEEKGQIFALAPDARIHVFNRRNGREIMSFDLGEAFKDESAVIFCEFQRCGDGWKYRGIDGKHRKSLADIARDFGIEV